MMEHMTLAEIAQACGGTLRGSHIPEDCAEGFVLDSRLVQKGYVFLATRGERVDGHSFIKKVMDLGALGVVCEEEPKDDMTGQLLDIPFILVDDSFQALKDIAEYYRSVLSCKVVGITGSVGKTSTKEFIASVLGTHYRVWKTQGNFNNEVGLPLTILQLRPEHEIAVLEMGINHFGEMHRMSKIARPDVCVMTNIGQCHLEFLGSRDGILKAKSEIFDYMNPEGYCVVNGDDDKLRTIPEIAGKRPIRFGMREEQLDYRAIGLENQGLFGTSIRVVDKKNTAFNTVVPLPGQHMIYNALAATAVGKLLGLSEEEIAAGIAGVEAVSGRSHVIRGKRYTILDDCYNANPVSMKAAIDLLTLALPRRVAILGDMFELGEEEKELHRQVGIYGANSEIEQIICIGKLAKEIYDGALSVQGKVEGLYFATKEDFLAEKDHVLKSGDTILLKASHGMHFEELIKELGE